MGLLEFLRQWPSRDLATGVLASALLHALVVLAVLLPWRPATETHTARQGDALIVELAEVEEPAAAGSPTSPAPSSRPRVTAPPVVARRAPASPPPAPPERRPEPPRPEASPAPLPAPEPPSPPPLPAPRAPEPLPVPAPSPVAVPTPVPSVQEASPAPPAVSPPPAPPVPPPALAAPAPSTLPTPAGETERRPVDGPPAPSPGDSRVAALPPSPGPAAPDSRSALRRGAGGSGQGRGGIEGEPIPLDTPDPRFHDYFEQLRRRIQAKWAIPCIRNPATYQCEPPPSSQVVELVMGIAKDGELRFLEVTAHASDHRAYDDYALNAIRLASPFPPVPASLRGRGAGLPVRVRFVYRVETSLRMLLQ